MSYIPPFTITDSILDLVSQISEHIGKLSTLRQTISTPQLRKINRIKTLVGTLQIEGNTLTEENVTAILDGKRVWGNQDEIEEAKGAIEAYKHLENYSYIGLDDLLLAHKRLTKNLLNTTGKFRHVNVAVGSHIAPPHTQISLLMQQLFEWLSETNLHPLIVSSIFHYEFEFIHPFEDGNGRVGRLWQTLILYRWKEIFAYLPLESIIKENQQAYYEAIEASTALGESTPFIVFMLESILETITTTPQDTPQVTPQELRLQKVLSFCEVPRSRKEIQEYVDMKDRKHFKEVVLDVLLADGLLEMTLPEKLQSPKQRYVISKENYRKEMADSEMVREDIDVLCMRIKG